MSLQEDLARAVAELQTLERAFTEVQSQLAAMRTLLGEYEGAISLIEELKKQKTGVKLLVPIGGGNFIQAEIKKVEDIQVSLGAGVMMRQPVDQGYETIKQRRERLLKAIELYENTLNQYAQRIEELRKTVNALSARLSAQQAQEPGRKT